MLLLYSTHLRKILAHLELFRPDTTSFSAVNVPTAPPSDKIGFNSVQISSEQLVFQRKSSISTTGPTHKHISAI